ncbi:pyruvate-formate lyase [Clostridium sp. CAG:253]|nr:pyruvate-formate lyase [Clostridium sp. CAG:253]
MGIKQTALYRRLKCIKQYASDYNVSIFKAVSSIKFVDASLEKILNTASIKNIGEAPFWYSLDNSIIVEHNGTRVVDNMPVDYSYIMDNFNPDSEVGKLVTGYVERANDPRINLCKPTNLKEALQSILFWNSLLWQTGHSLVGLGRLDKVLAKYKLDTDSENLITSFLLTLHKEYTYKSSCLKGDTGQIILLGGLEEDGSYYSNEYTYLFIKCLKKINLPDPKILVRCSANMPKDLLELSVDCASTGIGSPLFSNDDVIVPHLLDFGYDRTDAYNYGVSACWEPLSIGNSLEQNNLDNIEFGKCINETILDEKFVNCTSFEEVLTLYKNKLHHNCSEIKTRLEAYEWTYDPLQSCMMGLEEDLSMGGAKYNNYGILSIGMSSAIDSLLNIKKYVFESAKFTLKEIQGLISNDNVSEFGLNTNGFGTESNEAIELTNRIIRMAEDELKTYRNKFGGKVKFGLSSPSYILGAENVGATLDGRKFGEPFRTHISCDSNSSITQIMNFESKLEFSGISCNANVLDVMVQSTLIKDNMDKFVSYLMGGIKQGMFQLQMNVLSYQQLVDAKAHPEKYPNLIVRVWGFSAYFNDLPEEYKDNLIRRAKEMEMCA